MSKGAIVILCAGSSSRLGFPKALAIWNDSTLIEITVKACLQVPDTDVIIITGCHHDEILPFLTDEIQVIFNPNWASGMGSSISIGTQKMTDAHYEYVIITMVDQPKISAHHLNELIKTYYKTGKGIVTSYYKGILGPPVLFSNKYFSELMKLTGDHGAKPIISKHKNDVESLQFEGGELDIDTPDDLKGLP